MKLIDSDKCFRNLFSPELLRYTFKLKKERWLVNNFGISDVELAD